MTTISNADPEWVARPERGATAVIKLIVWIALRLGRPAAMLILYPICLYFMVFSSGTRAASRTYLSRALGRRPGRKDVFRHYHTFASCVLDRVFLLNDQTELFDIRVHGEEIPVEVLARGEGCLLLGAHLGSFEVLRALGDKQPGVRVALVMYEENARKINSVLNAINPKHAVEIISLGKCDSMLKVEERLGRGEFVGMLADRSLDGEGRMRRPFLGAAAPFPIGPFRIGAMLKQPVVLMFGLYRGGRRYDVYFERLADLTDIARDQRADVIEQMLIRYVERLEHYSRLAPYNWFNFYDFWK